MYHSVIGRRLLACVNKREGTNYTLRQFFDEVYFPLFFGNPRFLQNVNNSPLDQAVTKQKKPLTPALYAEGLSKIHEKTEEGITDGSLYLGGPAAGVTATTSGQVTSLQRQIPSEDIYASWIGTALGVGIDGGLSLLIDADEILLALYDGWTMYRKVLDQTPSLKPMQINTWNGQWLTYRIGGDWTMEGMVPLSTDKDNVALTTQTWPQLLFALASFYSKEPVCELTAYVYALGQTNRTVGFVRLELPKVRYLADLYAEIFTVPEGMHAKDFERLYETEQSFLSACSTASIGLRALRPKDVFKISRGEIPKDQMKVDASKTLSFQIYQTWIIAMLNNKELIKRTEDIASALLAHAQKDERGKNVCHQRVENALKTQNRRAFTEEITKILLKDSDSAPLFNEAVNEVMIMTPDNVPLFLTLLRFKYAVAQQSSKEKK
jgi:hypothetical protein